MGRMTRTRTCATDSARCSNQALVKMRRHRLRGQPALRRPRAAPSRASGCPEPRPASATKPLGPRWPASSLAPFLGPSPRPPPQIAPPAPPTAARPARPAASVENQGPVHGLGGQRGPSRPMDRGWPCSGLPRARSRAVSSRPPERQPGRGRSGP
eukprot:scaffold7438_cov51-Phaeocystis_antarctica.AAC.3